MRVDSDAKEHLKEKASFFKVLTSRFSILLYGLIQNNPIGTYTYAGLIILDHIATAFFLVLASNPNGRVQDFLDSRHISLIKSKDSEKLIFSLIFGFYSLLILVTIVFFMKLFSQRNYDSAKEHSLFKNFLAIFLVLQRTIFTYAMAFTGMLSFYIAYEIKGEPIMFVIIIFTVIAFSFYLMFFPIAISEYTSMIPSQQIPWGSIKSKSQYAREIFKALLIIQELYMPQLREEVVAHIGYYFGLILFLIFLSLKIPTYFNDVIHKVANISSRMVLSLALLCLFRLTFKAMLIEVLVYYPLVAFSVYRAFNWFEDKRIRKIVGKIQTQEKINHISQNEGLFSILKVLGRQNNQDLAFLQWFLNKHRSSCFSEKCCCHQYEKRVIHRFKHKDYIDKSKVPRLKSQDILKKENSEFLNENEIILEEGQVSFNDSRQDQSMLLKPSRNLEEPKHQQDTTNKIKHSDENILINEGYLIDNFSPFDLFKQIQDTEQFAENQNENQQVNSHLKRGDEQANANIASIREARKLFFIDLLDCVLKDLEVNMFQTIELSLHTHILYIYFLSTYLSKNYLAVFYLLRLQRNISRVGVLDRVSFNVIEQCILAETLQKNKGTVEGFDYAQFIEGNHKAKILDKLYETTTQDIIYFWTKLRIESSRGKEVDEIFQLGKSISQKIG